jgi:hypothetical protein
MRSLTLGAAQCFPSRNSRGGIHRVADWRSEACGVVPRFVDPTGEAREKELHFTRSVPAVRRMQNVQCHYLDKERRSNRLIVVIVPVLHHSDETLPLVTVRLLRLNRLVGVNSWIRLRPSSSTTIRASVGDFVAVT